MIARRRIRARVPGGPRGGVPTGPSRWWVTLPAWGDRYVEILLRHTLPALEAALAPVADRATLLVWTDQGDRVLEYMRSRPGGLMDMGVGWDIRPVPGTDGAFGSLSACHREGMRAASPHDRVLLLTADMVVSREVVETCERHLSGAARAVCCAAMRALEDRGAPAGASGRELLAWAWANRHPMTRECTWPEGRSYDVWRMYFERGGEVAARVFLPHPLAVVPGGRDLSFSPTIDVNLMHHFPRSATHMIVDPGEGAVVELSPEDKEFVLTETMATRMETRGPSCPPFQHCVNPRHRMFFEKRVTIAGDGSDCGDAEVVRRMLG